MRGFALPTILVVCAALSSSDVDDGLVSSYVGRIVTDSQGFLWFCIVILPEIPAPETT